MVKGKQIFKIEDENIIEETLQKSEYGTLALCTNNQPYSLPVNFVYLKGDIYFHGGMKGKKIDILKQNANVSFSVVESFSMIQSYFRVDDGYACPATQFFKSIIFDGIAVFVDNLDEKATVLEGLMQKLQSEGHYTKIQNNAMYAKMLKVTSIVKIQTKSRSAKFKFGQNLSQEQFEKVIQNLDRRDGIKDKQTVQEMKEYRALK